MMQSEQDRATSWSRRRRLIRKGLGAALILALALPLGYCGLSDTLNHQGICVREFRRIPDQELIQRWVEGEVKNYPPLDPRGIKDEKGQWQSVLAGMGEPIPYRDAADLLRLNPGCCSVESFDPITGYQPDSAEKRAGVARGFVRLEYKLRYRAADGSEGSKKYLSSIGVTNCGDLWRPF